MKYTQVMIAKEIPKNIKDTLAEQPARSGLYNWIFALGGEINTYWSIKDRLEDYDVIQVNASPKDMPMIPLIREQLKNSSTMLVVNNDYVCEYWEKFGIDPLMYDTYQRMGDMVFGTEPHQTSNLVEGAFCMPHPSNTKYLKKLGTDFNAKNSIGFIFHWWAEQTYLPYKTLNKVKKENDKINMTKMFSYMDGKSPMQSWHGIMFDRIVPLTNFPQFAQLIMGEACLYDPNPYHTYGRNGVECACWKQPVVGSDRVFSYSKLTPELTCDPFNTDKTRDIFKTVLNKDVDDILNRAYDDVEYFNYENSVKRYKEALDICKDRGGYEWYQKHR